ncbi:anti-sigma factor [Formosa agariphila KMM 3901]|uniref:Anti-sigma factor n=1 Tax=Formosa agariphila (strain DSM 15362 / KCTC 12365 / LMG 23005 / KMM 3901 / M-2Alg 35-1) TaxID=1347342 RepID=T2KKU8_FORAG|nr:FecR domain-containing protein [Formosa agariphila]CDF78634.1 anti-sigma factor [Formosa agariphila KMM 3901]
MTFKLIIKKIKKTLNQQESEIFDAWFNESPEHRAYFNKVKVNFNSEIDNFNMNEAWSKIQNSTQEPRFKVNWKYMVAAILIGILVTANFIVKQNDSENFIQESSKISEISIGSNKAILTLNDGSELELKEGNSQALTNASSNGKELIYKCSKKHRSEVIYNYLTIPRGGQYVVKLADNTKVWLNSETKIKYPVEFEEGQVRQVELIYGEAYFEVTSSAVNNGSSFRVLTKGQEIEVLGTEFNVSAYQNEILIYTTLVEGSVSIVTNEKEIKLKPGEQSILDTSDNSIQVQSTETYFVTAWKKGLFAFKNKTLLEIVPILSRWYDVEITIDDENLESVGFKGVLSKNQSIEQILELIKKTNFLKSYEIKGNKIEIKK